MTLKNSICHGRHFYAASSMRGSVWGVIHTFVLDELITNTHISPVSKIFRRLFYFWKDHIESQSSPSTTRSTN